MKRYLYTALAALSVLAVPVLVLADPGAEVPKPKHSLEEALKLAKAQFEKDAKAGKVTEEEMKDWIVIRAEFMPTEEKKRTDPWFWMITFAHRIANDRSCVIQVLPDGKVTSTGMFGK